MQKTGGSSSTMLHHQQQQHHDPPGSPTSSRTIPFDLAGGGGGGGGIGASTNATTGAVSTRAPRSRRASSTPKRPTTPNAAAASIPRRGSILSDISIEDAKSTLRSKTDEVLGPAAAEGSTWHSIPLAFAVAPAIAGAFLKNGEVLTTDALLLLLAGIFLHWLIKFPWEWYQNSAILAEREVFESLRDPRASPSDEAAAANVRSPYEELQRKKAHDELRQNERRALIACFVGPLIGGWLLHIIRSSLSRPSEGLVSNFNLTIFVLAAELRPGAQVVKLLRNRNEYLQSLVHHPPLSKMEVLAAKVDELRAEVQMLAELTNNTAKHEERLDALNRAVRRYERKEAFKDEETKNRIHEIDSKINDVLTLAAASTAAAQRSQPAMSFLLFQWCAAVIFLPFAMAWKVVSLPAKAVETLSNIRSPLLLKHSPSSSSSSQSGAQSGARESAAHGGAYRRATQAPAHAEVGRTRRSSKARAYIE